MAVALADGNESFICATIECHNPVHSKGYCKRCYVWHWKQGKRADATPKAAALAPVTDDTIASLAAGSPEALALVMLHWRRPLQAFALRRLKDIGQADEVTQDTFVTLWQHVGTLEDAEHLRPWLFKVCHNKCLDIYRKRSKKSCQGVLVPIEDAQQADLACESDFASRVEEIVDARAEVREVLDELSETSRQMLFLDAEGLTLKEMAARLGIPLGTVKSRLNYAKGRAQAVARKLRSA